MFISLNWIKDYVDLSGIDLKELVNKFTLSCAEVEGYEEKGKNVSGVVVGRILEVKDHPNSKKLHLLTVDVGSSVLNIVCGAPNVRVGLTVPVAVVGAQVGEIKIQKAMVGGYESYGMCCSAHELGISDDHSGLMELDESLKTGTNIKEILDIDDFIFEVDNKSLTNRPDMWGHYGIAREIAALVKRDLKPLNLWNEKNDLSPVKVQVDAKECFRYSTATMENITRKVSPLNMQIRLYYCGMRGINFLADVTNYIMLELGQPMHAFDNNLVKDIQVELARENTKFITLDEQERNLPAGSMLIKSAGEPVAIAGVMGGLKSGISDETNSVLIESACFDAYSVRKTALNIGLRTESSARYEKSLDPENTMIALRRFINIVTTYDKFSRVSSGITDIYNYRFPKLSIEITKDYIDKFIGIEIPENQILDILARLQFEVVVQGKGNYVVDVPSFRATKDIQGKADIVEEISRIYGYDNIKPTTTSQVIKPVDKLREVGLEYEMKFALAERYNLSETHSYIWYDNELNKTLGINPTSVIKVINSIQKDNNEIRSTMVPTMLKVVAENKNEFDSFGAFEIGRVVKELNEDGTVNETKSLCITLASKGNREEQLLKLKEIVEYIVRYIAKVDLKIQKGACQLDYINPSNFYEFYSGEEYLGYIGFAHPLVERKLDSKIAVALCEIDFTKLCEMEEKEYKMEKVSKYPKSEFDFNFLIPSNMLYSEIEKIATSVQSDLNYAVSLLDIYEPENSEFKSYTIHYTVVNFDRTMTGEELENFHKLVIQTFNKKGISLKD